MRRLHAAGLSLVALTSFGSALGQVTLPTTTELSTTLAKQCSALTIDSTPKFETASCSAKDKATATADEVTQCRSELLAAAAKTFSEEIDKTLATQTAEILKRVEGDSRVVQRLHAVLVRRQRTLDTEIATATKKAGKDISIAATGTDTLLARGIASATAPPALALYVKAPRMPHLTPA